MSVDILLKQYKMRKDKTVTIIYSNVLSVFDLSQLHVCLLSLRQRYSLPRACCCCCIMGGNTHTRTQPPVWRSTKAVSKCVISNFKSVFNSMSQASLWAILEAYGIPDIDLLKSLYKHTTVRLPERGMGRAKITFDTGVAQGSVLSPLLFSLVLNALSRYLSDLGR
jgi:hypothetical protein